jgi:hypothetical protein
VCTVTVSQKLLVKVEQLLIRNRKSGKPPGPERKARNQKNCRCAGGLHWAVLRHENKFNLILFSITFWILSVNLKFEVVSW